MYKLLGTYQEEWEKQTINHYLYFFQLWVSMLLEIQFYIFFLYIMMWNRMQQDAR